MWNPFAPRNYVNVQIEHTNIELTFDTYYVGRTPDDIREEHRVVDIRTIEPIRVEPERLKLTHRHQ